MTATSSILNDGHRRQAQSDAGRLRSAAVASSGNIVYLALGFLANLVLIRGLSPHDYGLFSISNGFLIVLQEVTGGGIDVATIRCASATSENRSLGRVAASALQIKLLVNTGLAIMLWAAAPVLAERFFHSPEATTAIRLAGIGALGSSVYTLVLSLLQAQERFLGFSLHRVGNNFLRLTIFAAFVRWGNLDLDRALAVTAGSLLLSSLIGLMMVRPALSEVGTVDRATWRLLLGFGAAVTVSRLLFTLYGRLDLFFIAHYRTTVETGVYSVATNLAYLIDLTTYSIILTFLPLASRLRHQRELGDYCRKTLRVSAIFASGMLVLFLGARPIMELLFSRTYSDSADLFRILSVGCLVTLFVHPLYLILYSRNKPHLLIWSDLTLVMVAMAGHPWAVTHYGNWGAAVTTVVARLAGCAVILFLVHREVSSREWTETTTEITA